MMDKERYMKYVDIADRAIDMGLVRKSEKTSVLTDIEGADRKFALKLDEWIAADDYNFAHDLLGIRNNINRGCGFPATDFGLFLPIFAGNALEMDDAEAKGETVCKNIISHSGARIGSHTRTHI